MSLFKKESWTIFPKLLYLFSTIFSKSDVLKLAKACAMIILNYLKSSKSVYINAFNLGAYSRPKKLMNNVLYIQYHY